MVANRPKVFLTTNQRKEIRDLTLQGHSLRELADMFGCSRRQISRIREDFNIQRPARVPLNEDELTLAKKLLVGGCSYSEVGRTLGRSPSAVRNNIPGYGWPQSGAGHFWRLSKKLEAI